MLPSGISVNRRLKMSLQSQLENAFRKAILNGTLAANERVLSTRELQVHLGLSRNTVLNAFEQLHAEGYLVTRRGVGTFVAPRVGTLPKISRGRPQSRVVPSSASQRHLETSFKPGTPALELFPSGIFRKIFAKLEISAGSLGYGDAFGSYELRGAIARRLQQTRGVVTSPEHIMITDGAQAAFALIVDVMLSAGDRVIVEDPGYPNVRAILLAARARIDPRRVDESGLDVASFANVKAKLAYVTPSHQYPMGEILSLDRRLQLLDWASRHSAWIIEDDYDSEFNYTNRPIPALQGLAPNARVIYVGTFSKVLAPALRIGYVVLPDALVDVFRAAHVIRGGAPDAFMQLALARFIDGGHLGRHIARMRKIYDARREMIAEGLTTLRPGTFRVHDTRAGLHFVAELAQTISDVAFAKNARTHGVLVPALSSYFLGRARRNGIVLGYAASTPSQIPPALKALRAALDMC